MNNILENRKKIIATKRLWKDEQESPVGSSVYKFITALQIKVESALKSLPISRRNTKVNPKECEFAVLINNEWHLTPKAELDSSGRELIWSIPKPEANVKGSDSGFASPGEWAHHNPISGEITINKHYWPQ